MASAIGSNFASIASSSLSSMGGAAQLADFSALTNPSNLSSKDKSTLSSVLGSDYATYQSMLSSSGASATAAITGSNAVTAAGGIGAVGNGVGTTSDGMFDFSSYLTTYFPNLSSEEVSNLTSFYTEQYNQMYAQIGKAMDMSSLAGLAMGSGTGTDTDSILSSAKSASKKTMSFDISSYLETNFPNLSSKQISDLSSTYKSQYEAK